MRVPHRSTCCSKHFTPNNPHAILFILACPHGTQPLCSHLRRAPFSPPTGCKMGANNSCVQEAENDTINHVLVLGCAAGRRRRPHEPGKPASSPSLPQQASPSLPAAPLFPHPCSPTPTHISSLPQYILGHAITHSNGTAMLHRIHKARSSQPGNHPQK